VYDISSSKSIAANTLTVRPSSRRSMAYIHRSGSGHSGGGGRGLIFHVIPSTPPGLNGWQSNRSLKFFRARTMSRFPSQLHLSTPATAQGFLLGQEKKINYEIIFYTVQVFGKK
jgi:hypothetical protein